MLNGFSKWDKELISSMLSISIISHVTKLNNLQIWNIIGFTVSKLQEKTLHQKHIDEVQLKTWNKLKDKPFCMY